ncbi:MAG: hypothetical protein AAF541_05845 [Pseudomonadota bacterium]
MTRYQVLVLTEPTDGNEERFNQYYEHTHLEEVLATTNFTSAQRFKLVASAGENAPLPYLAVYETEGESPDAVLADLSARRTEREQSDSLNLRTGRVWVFEETGPKHSR